MRKPIVVLVFFCVIFTLDTLAQEKKSITLHSLIENALQSNHQLAKLQLAQGGTEVKKKLVQSTFIPQISANAMYGYGKFGISDFHLSIPIPLEAQGLGAKLAPALGLTENPIPPEFSTDLNLEYSDLQIFTAGINAEWVLFTGMKATYTNRALNHTYNAQEQLINKQASEIVAEVVDYYDKLVLIRESESVISNSRARLNKEKERVSKAFNQGLITRYDVQKIEIAELELELKALELSNNKYLIMIKLKQLCNVDENDLLSMETGLSAMEFDSRDISIDDRPEMKALDEKELAMENKLKSVNSGYMPKVAAIANYQYADLDVMKVDPLAFVGVGAKWELFDGLKTSREKQLVKLEILQEQKEKDHIRELLELDIEMKLSNTQQAVAQLALQEKLVEKSGLALEIKSKEYAQGLCDISAWLEADNDYQKAQLNYHKAIFDQRHAAIELLKIRGDLQNNYALIIE